MMRGQTQIGIARWGTGLVAVLVLAALIGSRLVSAETQFGRTDAGAATPVSTAPAASDPHDGDAKGNEPLDGDPLDGEPDGNVAPRGARELEVVRSGRPTSAPASLAAYDGDLQTAWDPGKEPKDAWLWLDLGQERQVREVRWLARGSGAVDIAVSKDRDRWHEIARQDVRQGWVSQPLSDDARYVRLTLHPDASGQLPQVTEVTIYGDDAKNVDLKQDAKSKHAKKDRQSAKSGKNGKTDSGKPKTADKGTSGGKRRNASRSTEPVEVSAAPGETSCDGNRARCKAQDGQMQMEGACGKDGSCTIDVQVDGGAAVCDATGGENTKASQGEGNSGGNGGRCDATANGGAIAIGDINP